MMKLSGAVVFGVLAIAMTARPAMADTYEVNSFSVPIGVNTSVNDTILGISGDGAQTGEISISTTDETTQVTSQLSVWCSDISGVLGAPAAYTTGTLNADIGGTGYAYLTTARVNDVNALLNAVQSGVLGPLTSITSAAVQAAIWELIYQSGTTFNVGAGNFFISEYGGDASTVCGNMTGCTGTSNAGTDTTANTVIYDANQYLTYIANGTWQPNTNGTVVQLNLSPVNGGNQTLIYLASSTTGQQAVPEPASIALLASGLVGFGAVRRRRRAQA